MMPRAPIRIRSILEAGLLLRVFSCYFLFPISFESIPIPSTPSSPRNKMLIGPTTPSPILSTRKVSSVIFSLLFI